jgi:hypothetical protein
MINIAKSNSGRLGSVKKAKKREEKRARLQKWTEDMHKKSKFYIRYEMKLFF